ncbi:N-acetylmuramoyl-L-alanine amidase [Klebsiella pneumoniae]|uniref:N-acetylmuramoyl-L-alanine amidase n=1 Tax=Klebsiella pneumoniae TaxID=573 RepID=A0A378CET5_KLEPN|nr:N-acetylmuramoyl-L-alanine amidase [Klebsiella pneumoniae]STV69904.1 N-acetylmuramoyl-L-alanine amidase [Klebsiella pneumoniae]
MQLNEGWLVGARRVPSPHHDCRPDEETPSLLVVHNISLPPGNLVVRGLMRCSLVPWIRTRILSLPRLLICAFRRIV